MDAWAEAARLLEQEAVGEDADLNREVLEAARRLDWQEAGCRMLSAHLELAREGEDQAARWAAQALANLRPKGWEQAPKGEALVQAVLAAYRERVTQASISPMLQPYAYS